MNKTRRKQICDLKDKIYELLNELEGVQDDEQNYFDAMPESLQSGEKGTRSEEALSSIESAMDSLNEAISYLEECVE